MSILVLNLPLPPSTNELYRNVPGRGRVKSTAYKQWIKAATSELWGQKPQGGFPFFPDAFSVLVLVPLTMRGDCDNRLKAPIDFLKKGVGCIPDDRKAFETTCRRSAGVPVGTCRVMVGPANMQEAA